MINASDLVTSGKGVVCAATNNDDRGVRVSIILSSYLRRSSRFHLVIKYQMIRAVLTHSLDSFIE